MSGAAHLFDPRVDPFGRPSRRRRVPGSQAAVFVPEEALRLPHLPLGAAPEDVQWRAGALAALHAFQAHGYELLLCALPADLAGPASRSASFNAALLRRLAQEAEVRATGVLPHADVEALPPLLQQVAALHGLDLRRAWFLSWDEALGVASRRVGCRSVRLLEPGRSARRRWPLLRGHVPMKLADAVSYVLRCDGHLAAGHQLPAQA